MDKQPDVTLNDVSFSYNSEPILENVHLNIAQGDFATIVGPNGGGKTTLLKLLLGILRPKTGEIRILGKKPEKSRKKVGYMPQYIYLDLKFPVTVMDVVLMGRLGHNLMGWFSKRDKQVAMDALEEVKLSDFTERSFSDLSGGQRQRVLIARALSCEPELLLLDEPTANVDPEVEEALLGILQELNKRMTILLVSHDLGFVSKVVKSVICVNRKVLVHPTSEINGRIIEDIYGGDLRIIRHDHRCSEMGHHHV